MGAAGAAAGRDHEDVAGRGSGAAAGSTGREVVPEVPADVCGRWVGSAGAVADGRAAVGCPGRDLDRAAGGAAGAAGAAPSPRRAGPSLRAAPSLRCAAAHRSGTRGAGDSAGRAAAGPAESSGAGVRMDRRVRTGWSGCMPGAWYRSADPSGPTADTGWLRRARREEAAGAWGRPGPPPAGSAGAGGVVAGR